MVRRFYKLPSLNALGAFEAAARHSNLSFAAAELNVTPSAVSKHVTFLEQELGISLFVRGHRTMRLTPEGEQLHDHPRGSDRRQDLRRLEETAEPVNQYVWRGLVASCAIG